MADGQSFCGQCGLTLDMEADPAAIERVGQVLDGRYRLEYLIGIGGMGAIYRAEVIGSGHTVAVKVLHPAYSADPVSRQRLANEAQLASQVDHPNIVSIFDFRSSPSLTYLVMEYLSGQSLAEVLGAIGYLGVRRTVHIARQLLSALESAYRVNVLHRDLKPENIYLIASADGVDFVKVLDFGMAMLGHGPRITNDGRICGTPAYMSPEQARGQPLDHRSDLYAVGVILFECLTAVNPFLGESAPDTLVNHVTLAAPPPSKMRTEAKIPPYVDALVLRALRKSPADRFQSATEFRQVLEGLVLAQHAPLQPAADGATASAQSFSTCSECGRPVQQDARRCTACGQLLTHQPRTAGKLEDLLSPELISALHRSRQQHDSGALQLDATSTITACPIIGDEPPLVGVAREQQQIARMFEEPHGHVVLRLLGAPGTGKGRLARDAFRRAVQRNWRTVWLEPASQATLAALEPIRSTALRLLGVDPADAGDEDALLDAAARIGFAMDGRQGLLELFGLASSSDPADDRRARRADAWRALVQAAARRTPLLLVFRDLDQMDGPSQELVSALATLPALPTHPVHVIVTQDPGLMLLWPKTETWAISALSLDHAVQLARHLIDAARIDADPARIAAASHGVPLMLIELVRLTAIDPLARLPRELAEVINRRLSRLPPRPRMLVHAVAVLGRPCLPEVLSEVIGEPADAGALTLLAKHGFITPGPDGWRPAHRVHRSVAYASTPAAVRATLHRKAADLALRGDAPAAQVAHHLFAVGDFRAALPHLLRAGWNALESLDDARAAEQFNQALQIVPGPPRTLDNDRDPWISANIGLSTALADAGDHETALQLIRGAVRTAAAAGWADEQARLEAQRDRLA